MKYQTTCNLLFISEFPQNDSQCYIFHRKNRVVQTVWQNNCSKKLVNQDNLQNICVRKYMGQWSLTLNIYPHDPNTDVPRITL